MYLMCEEIQYLFLMFEEVRLLRVRLIGYESYEVIL